MDEKGQRFKTSEEVFEDDCWVAGKFKTAHREISNQPAIHVPRKNHNVSIYMSKEDLDVPRIKND